MVRLEHDGSDTAELPELGSIDIAKLDQIILLTIIPTQAAFARENVRKAGSPYPRETLNYGEAQDHPGRSPHWSKRGSTGKGDTEDAAEVSQTDGDLGHAAKGQAILDVARLFMV